MTTSIITFSITQLSMMCSYAKCRILIVMLSVFILNVVVLSVMASYDVLVSGTVVVHNRKVIFCQNFGNIVLFLKSKFKLTLIFESQFLSFQHIL